MLLRKISLLGAIFVVLISGVSLSEATLWDLLIEANLEKGVISSEGEAPVITGRILDQAYKPVDGAEVTLRSGERAVITMSDSDGNFRAELSSVKRIPGNYIVNIAVSTDEGLFGLTSLNFQVIGESTVSADIVQKLSTPFAQKYLNADAGDFEGDSIGMRLYGYYQELQQQYNAEKALEGKVSEEEQFIQEIRDESLQLRQQDIEEANPGPGTYSGWKYDVFVSNLDNSVRDSIVDQLNYTTNAFVEAQKAMDEVLENGGTMKEARQTYYEKITITREVMNNIITGEESEPIYEIERNESEVNISEEIIEDIVEQNTEEEHLIIDANGIPVKIELIDSVIFLNVNGTTIQLEINGSEIQQIQ